MPFFVTPTLPALSRVPPAVCPSMLESATTDSVCTSFLQSLSAYVHTEIPHTILPFCNLFPHTYIRRFHIRTYADASSILRFSPAPQTPDLHTSYLPQWLFSWKLEVFFFFLDRGWQHRKKTRTIFLEKRTGLDNSHQKIASTLEKSGPNST